MTCGSWQCPHSAAGRKKFILDFTGAGAVEIGVDILLYWEKLGWAWLIVVGIDALGKWLVFVAVVSAWCW